MLQTVNCFPSIPSLPNLPTFLDVALRRYQIPAIITVAITRKVFENIAPASRASGWPGLNSMMRELSWLCHDDMPRWRKRGVVTAPESWWRRFGPQRMRRSLRPGNRACIVLNVECQVIEWTQTHERKSTLTHDRKWQPVLNITVAYGRPNQLIL